MLRTRVARTFLLGALSLNAAPLPAANIPPDVATFPNVAVDYTTGATSVSLPSFQWNVDATVQPVLAASGSQFYDKTTKTYVSGGLSDFNYQLGLSAAITEGSPADMNGVAVGSAGTMVADKNFTSVPAGFEGPAGTREVHSQILSLDLADTKGNELQAGAVAAKGTTASFGEFESTTGNVNNDFPSKSFFDVFFTLVVPGIGTLTNVKPGGGGTPLIIATNKNNNQYNLVQLVNAPPTNVPTIYFLTVDPALGNFYQPGDTAGTLQLLQAQSPEPASVVLALMAGAGLFWFKRHSRKRVDA